MVEKTTTLTSWVNPKWLGSKKKLWNGLWHLWSSMHGWDDMISIRSTLHGLEIKNKSVGLPMTLLAYITIVHMVGKEFEKNLWPLDICMVVGFITTNVISAYHH